MSGARRLSPVFALTLSLLATGLLRPGTATTQPAAEVVARGQYLVTIMDYLRTLPPIRLQAPPNAKATERAPAPFLTVVSP